MKRLIILFISLMKLTSVTAQGRTDTLLVSLKQTTYVVCKDSIEWFEIGSKEYTGKVLGTTFFIKPLKQNASPTSLLIKSGDAHIYKTLSYSEASAKTFYDLRANNPVAIVEVPKNEKVVEKEVQEEVTDETETVRKATVAEKQALAKFIEITDPFKSIATSKDRVVLSLGNIKAQGKDVYIKYNLSNYSGHRFNIDSYDLIFINQSGHLLGSNTAFETPVTPIVEQISKYVDPSQRGVIGFIVPGEQISTKGKIFLRLKENPGSKLIALEVPTSLFQKN